MKTMKKFKTKLQHKDTVIVTTGKSKGHVGELKELLLAKGRVVVEGANMVKKHVRPNPQIQETGGIKEMEASLELSNVAIYNEATKKADRVGYKILEDGRKVRVFRSTGEQIDI